MNSPDYRQQQENEEQLHHELFTALVACYRLSAVDLPSESLRFLCWACGISFDDVKEYCNDNPTH